MLIKYGYRVLKSPEMPGTLLQKQKGRPAIKRSGPSLTAYFPTTEILS